MKLSEIIENVNEEFSGEEVTELIEEEVEYDTYSVPEDGYTLVPLASVGCWICSYAGSESDISVGTTFPSGMNDEEMVEDGGVHLDDCSDEWWDSLDTDDLATCKELI